MSASPQSRVPAGVTTGGQYSTSARGEADVSLAVGMPVTDEIRQGAFAHEDPTWAAGMLAPRAELDLTRPEAVPFDDPDAVESAVASVQTSHLASARADHAAHTTVLRWLSWAKERASDLVPGSPQAQRYGDFEAGIRHGVLALYSSTAEVREDYVVARLQRELGGAPAAHAFTRVRREMTSKRTSKASRTEWASAVRTAPEGPMRRGMLVAGLALSGQDGWWRARENPEAAVGR